jgi:hypothetical protein
LVRWTPAPAQAPLRRSGKFRRGTGSMRLSGPLNLPLPCDEMKSMCLFSLFPENKFLSSDWVPLSAERTLVFTLIQRYEASTSCPVPVSSWISASHSNNSPCLQFYPL